MRWPSNRCRVHLLSILAMEKRLYIHIQQEGNEKTWVFCFLSTPILKLSPSFRLKNEGGNRERVDDGWPRSTSTCLYLYKKVVLFGLFWAAYYLPYLASSIQIVISRITQFKEEHTDIRVAWNRPSIAWNQLIIYLMKVEKTRSVRQTAPGRRLGQEKLNQQSAKTSQLMHVIH